MRSLLTSFSILCYLLTLGHSEIIPFTDCSAPGYKVLEVSFSPCPTFPCQFKKNTTVTERVVYAIEENGKDLPQLTTKLFAIINEEVFYYPLDDEDACKHFTPTCPLHPNQEAVSELDIFIRSTFPTTNLTSKITRQNSTGDSVLCYTFPSAVLD